MVRSPANSNRTPAQAVSATSVSSPVLAVPLSLNPKTATETAALTKKPTTVTTVRSPSSSAGALALWQTDLIFKALLAFKCKIVDDLVYYLIKQIRPTGTTEFKRERQRAAKYVEDSFVRWLFRANADDRLDVHLVPLSASYNIVATEDLSFYLKQHQQQLGGPATEAKNDTTKMLPGYALYLETLRSRVRSILAMTKPPDVLSGAIKGGNTQTASTQEEGHLIVARRWAYSVRGKHLLSESQYRRLKLLHIPRQPASAASSTALTSPVTDSAATNVVISERKASTSLSSPSLSVRAADAGHSTDFEHDVVMLLERYHFLGGLNTHLAVPPFIYPAAAVELFGTPFNTSHAYCSPFADEVVRWQSLGSFFGYELWSRAGVYVAGPPFDECIMRKMSQRLVQQLQHSLQSPAAIKPETAEIKDEWKAPRIEVMVTLPIWDSESQRALDLPDYGLQFSAYSTLVRSPFLKQRRTLLKDEAKYFDYFTESYLPVSNTHILLLANHDDQLTLNLDDICQRWREVSRSFTGKAKICED